MAATRDISVRVRVVGDKEYRAAMKRISAATGSFAKDTALGNLASEALQKALTALKNTIESSIKASVSFESALANVGKTTGMNETELKYFGEEMKALSTQIPITAEELLGLAEAAGQLGIADKDIQEFTEVMAAMGVSTNLTAEMAADSLARIANIMGTEASEYERMGSAIVELGNNSAATESEIVEMSTRLAGAAKLAGLTEADIFGLATALASVGINAEAGGGSMSTLLTNISIAVATGSSELISLATIAGMTATEFKRAWEADPAMTLNAWIDGLAEMEANGQSALVALEDLGITQIRQRQAVTSLVGAQGMLGEVLEMSNQAWKDNNALQEEAGKRYATSESQLAMYKNQVTNFKLAIGDKWKVGIVEDAKMLQELAAELTDFLDGAETLDSMIADIDASYEVKSKGIKEAEFQAYALVDAMEALGNTDQLDNVSLREFFALAEQLKLVAPETAKLVNTMTGEIDGGYEAMRRSIAEGVDTSYLSLEVWKAEEQTAAYEVAMKRYELAATQAQIAVAELRSAEEEYNALAVRQSEMQAEARRKATEAAAQGQFVDETDFLLNDAEYLALGEEIAAASEKVTQATVNLSNWQNEATDSAAALREYGRQVDATFSGIGETVEDTGVQFNDLELQMLRTTEAAVLATENLYNAYEEARVEARESLDTMFSGFNKVAIPPAERIEDMSAGLQSQIEYMTEYTDLLNQARQMGLGEDLLSMLSDGSESSFAYLKGIVESGGEGITELQNQLSEIQTLKDEMAESMAAAQVNLDEEAAQIDSTLTGMVDKMNQNPAAYSNAAATVQGAIDGYNSKIPSLLAVVRRIQSIANAARSYTGVWTGAGTAGYTPHAAGLEYVPYDGYPAMLHRGEMVLTALEAKAYRAEQFANYGMLAALDKAGTKTTNNTSNSKTYNTSNNSYRFGDIYVRNDRDMRELTGRIAERKRREARGRGAR